MYTVRQPTVGVWRVGECVRGVLYHTARHTDTTGQSDAQVVQITVDEESFFLSTSEDQSRGGGLLKGARAVVSDFCTNTSVSSSDQDWLLFCNEGEA